jgi:DNA-binding GntR family transcriptional regulator
MTVLHRGPRESARDFALRALKHSIIRLELAPGSMVSEHELAQELGLSRGPVREALIELAKVKMVEVLPQRGSVISLVDYGLVDEARFVRETLEAAVAVRCCEAGISPERLEALRENIRLQELYLEDGNVEKLWELDDAFHALLFKAAGLSQAHALMKGIQIHFDRIRAMGTTPIAGPRNVEDHRRIFEAVSARDESAARALMRKHLQNFQVDRETVCARDPQYMKLA